MQWFYVINSERAGPVSQEQFDGLVQSGAITGATLVWRAGMPEWRSWAQASAEIAAQSDSAVCAVSGRIFPKREMIEYQGMWVSAECKDVFFQRIREGLPPAGVGAGGAREVRYAGFWLRVAAYIIDAICLNIVMFVIMFFVGILIAVIGRSSEMLLNLIIWTLSFGLAILYEVFFVRAYDATPGKLAVGVKILMANGDKLTVGRIIGRYFAKILSGLVFCIGFMMAGWDDQKRGLHDMLCETRVVKK